MKVLIQHIEKLLPDHDCVVVPGLGGFVQNVIAARFDPQSDLFYPEGKEICFNARLTFNDGFLAQAYQETFECSFEESNAQIHLGVNELQDKLEGGKYVSLGQIGVMWKNEQGLLAFRSDNKNSFLPDAYGLSTYSFPNMEKRLKKRSYTEHQTTKRKNDDFINIRLRRNSFRNLLTGAAACLFMLLLAKPVGNKPGINNQEAFLMHNYISSPKDDVLQEENPYEMEEKVSSKQANPIPEIDRANETKVTIDSQPVKSANYTENDIVPPAKPLKVNRKSTKKIDVIAPTHEYYIIIGSFPEKELAEDWIKEQGHGGVFKYAGIIVKDGRARVYSRSFPDKEVAEAYLNQFRASNPDYASAWLLSSKK